MLQRLQCIAKYLLFSFRCMHSAYETMHSYPLESTAICVQAVVESRNWPLSS